MPLFAVNFRAIDRPGKVREAITMQELQLLSLRELTIFRKPPFHYFALIEKVT